MAAATIEAYAATNYTTATATGVDEVTASISWLAGDLIVVVGVTENDDATIDVPTASGLTFSQIVFVGGPSDCQVYVWTATAAADGSSAVTANTVSGASWAKGISAFVCRNHSGVGDTSTIDNSTAKVISVDRAGTDSAVIVVMGDFNATADVTVTASPSTDGTVRTAVTNAAAYSVYILSWVNQGAAGTTSYGMASHTGTVDMAGIAVEIKGSVAGGRTTKNTRAWPLGMEIGMGWVNGSQM